MSDRQPEQLRTTTEEELVVGTDAWIRRIVRERRTSEIKRLTERQEGKRVTWNFCEPRVMFSPQVQQRAFPPEERPPEESAVRDAISEVSADLIRTEQMLPPGANPEQEDMIEDANEDAECSFIRATAAEVFRSLPRGNMTLVDMGPGGVPRNLKTFLHAVNSTGRNSDVTYLPIESNPMGKEAALQYARDTVKCHVPDQWSAKEFGDPDVLRELPPDLKNQFRLVSILGLGLNNIRPEEYLQILKTTIGDHGIAYATLQPSDRLGQDKMPEIRKRYAGPVFQQFYKCTLEQFGMPEDCLGEITVTNEGDDVGEYSQEAVRVYQEIVKVTDDMKMMGMEQGDRVLVLRTDRLSRASLKRILDDDFDLQFLEADRDGEFMGALIAPKGKLNTLINISKLTPFLSETQLQG